MPRPRVVVDARMVRASGIGTYLRAVLPRIIASRQQYDFVLLGHDPLLREFAAAGAVRVHEVDAPIYGLGEQRALQPWAASPDVVFWSPHYNIPLLGAARRLVTVHDTYHVALPHLVAGWHRRAYARAMFAAVRRRAAHICFDSEFTARSFRELVGEPRGSSRVVHLGVDEAWSRIPAGARPHARPYVLYVGNVKPHKDIGTLVSAFGSVMAQLPHDLVVVGKREGILQDAELAGRAAPLGERVRFTGEVSFAELQQYVRHAELFVLPSLFEGFGLPVLEAMAAGCPVVASDAASIPEVGGDAARYFRAGRPEALAPVMLEVLNDDAQRERMRAAGRERARGFGWDACVEGTLAAIDAVVERER